MDQESWYEKLLRIKQQLINCATGDGYSGPNDFESLRIDWLKHPLWNKKMPSCVKQYRSLSEYRTFTQTLGGYKERRAYICDTFAPILSELEAEVQAPSDDLITGKLKYVDEDHIKEAWIKVLERRDSDVEGAITSSRSLLETVCKHILDDLTISYDDKADLPKLYSLVATSLNLSPIQHTEQVFKQILGGCHSVVEGLGALRNKHSEAHGKGIRAVKAAPRHAELAVNLAGSMALFLVSTWELKKSKRAISTSSNGTS